MPQIHPTAVIDPAARIASDVTIGPFCVIEEDVEIQAGCRLAGRVTIKRGTRLGPDNEVSENTVLGGRPQHLRAGNQVGRLEIGSGNTIRENVTMHVGLTPDDATRVGSRNLIMVGVHIAHDCRIGDQTILANNVLLAGHIDIDDYAYLSGAVAVHQFCRIGRHAMVGGQAHIKKDVPPFVTVDGFASQIVGLNVIGLRRRGFEAEAIAELKRAYRVAYRSGLTWQATLERLRAEFSEGPAAPFTAFFADGQRGYLQERRTPKAAVVSLVEPADEKTAAQEKRRAA